MSEAPKYCSCKDADKTYRELADHYDRLAADLAERDQELDSSTAMCDRLLNARDRVLALCDEAEALQVHCMSYADEAALLTPDIRKALALPADAPGGETDGE